MIFSRKNHAFETDTCTMLKSDCVMGRPGCVLEGKVNLTPGNIARIQKLKYEEAVQRNNGEK